MIAVKSELHGELRDVLGREVIINLSDGATVNQLLQRVAERAGETFKRKICDSTGKLLPRPLLKIQVNASDCGFEQKLKEGDLVSIFPLVSFGGG